MNTANLENCKKLYELSGWTPGSYHRWWIERSRGIVGRTTTENMLEELSGMGKKGKFTPAYSSGFLLRKLPTDIQLDKMSGLGEDGEDKEYYHICRLVAEHHTGETALENGTEWLRENEYDADTPEDAICLLAIKLFEEGILIK